ncbi:MAG TPA: alkaline phosphatase family protein [Planctomycetota bacterium]|nr:alkaline phosphatase family protein [Planctomycetota bacterium]
MHRSVALFALVLFAGCTSGGGGSSSSASTVAPTTSSSTSPTTSSTTPGSTTTPPTPAAQTYPIDHIFIIFKENHTFDNFFGSYPGANGVMSATDSKGATVPLTNPVADIEVPGSNGWDSAHTDSNNGLMNNFDLGENGSFYGLTFLTCGPFTTYSPVNAQPGGPAMYYWQIAQQGVLCDNYFTSVMGCSTPNHLFSVAAQCGGIISNENLSTHTWTQLLPNGTQVTNHPNHLTAAEVPTALPCELEAKGLTWKYFAENQGFGSIGQLITTLEDNDASVKGLDVVSALPDFAHCYDSNTAAMDVNLAPLLQSGEVGNVTWIRPAPLVCEHPGVSSVTAGAAWTKAVVNEIGASQYWDHCAILITFDDYGGWYDHVAPPQLDYLGLGFRVPCIIVSPYAKKGFVDKTQLEHASLCKFAETIFGLPAMSTRDAQSADMTEAFDFTQPPRPFSDFKF